MVTADHGPAVSGAHNTIVTARAGQVWVGGAHETYIGPFGASGFPFRVQHPSRCRTEGVIPM